MQKVVKLLDLDRQKCIYWKRVFLLTVLTLRYNHLFEITIVRLPTMFTIQTQQFNCLL